jgi:hypothetical protein
MLPKSGVLPDLSGAHTLRFNIFFTAKGAKIFRKGRKQGRMSKQFVQFARGEKLGAFFLIKNLWGCCRKKNNQGSSHPMVGNPQ